MVLLARNILGSFNIISLPRAHVSDDNAPVADSLKQPLYDAVFPSEQVCQKLFIFQCHSIKGLPVIFKSGTVVYHITCYRIYLLGRNCDMESEYHKLDFHPHPKKYSSLKLSTKRLNQS